MQFYVVQIEFLMGPYAYFEVVDSARYTVDAPSCPACGNAVGLLRGWAAPNEVVIGQPHRIGDFLRGAGGCEFLVTQRVLDCFEQNELTGLERIFPVKIRRKRTKTVRRPETEPKLFGVEIVHTTTQIAWLLSETEVEKPPRKGSCRLCTIARRHKKNGGQSRSQNFVVKEATWTGQDIFHPINLHGRVLVSERAKEAISAAGFENIELVPSTDYGTSNAKKSKRSTEPKSGSKATVEVLGVYRLPVTDELVRRQCDVLYGRERQQRKRARSMGECRRQLESTVLVEVLVHGVDRAFDLGDFTQREPEQPRSSWQAPWAEAYMAPDGESLAEPALASDGTGRDMRIAFYMHFWQTGEPLVTSYGDVPCPPPSEMPERLIHLVPYELLD